MENLGVRGSDAQGAYDPSVEWQHGFSVDGVQGMTLTNVQARETWGDGIDLGNSANTPTCGDDASSARNVVIDGATLERNGRQTRTPSRSHSASGCGGRAGVLLVDSHTVGITGNAFTGANRVYLADGLSTGVTATDNTL